MNKIREYTVHYKSGRMEKYRTKLNKFGLVPNDFQLKIMSLEGFPTVERVTYKDLGKKDMQ